MQAGHASWLVNNQSEMASNSLWHFVILSSWHQLCFFQPNILRIYGNQSTNKVSTGLVDSFCVSFDWNVQYIQSSAIAYFEMIFFSAFYVTSPTCISSGVAKSISEKKSTKKILSDLIPQSNVLKLEFIVYFWGPSLNIIKLPHLL